MQTLFMLILGIVAIFLIARFNKSNKMFWILLMSMLAGFVGGSIASSISQGNAKKETVYKQDFTQSSIPVLTAIYSEITGHDTQIFMTKAVGKNTVYYNSNLAENYTMGQKVYNTRDQLTFFDTS